MNKVINHNNERELPRSMLSACELLELFPVRRHRNDDAGAVVLEVLTCALGWDAANDDVLFTLGSICTCSEVWEPGALL